VRVLVVDDHALFTDAILPVLREMGMEVQGVARSGSEGLLQARAARPELVMVDLGLPDMSGIDLGRLILAEFPGTTVLALTGRKDPQAVSEASAAGFAGYLTKDTPLPKFADRIRAALRGEVVAPQRMETPRVVTRTAEEQSAALLAGQLTPRELEVLSLLVTGSDNADIARRLSVSANTVRTHVQSILTKLGVRSRLQAAAFAVRHQVVEVRRGGSLPA
jgi:two-component system, NarL family, nitrate/nitrite response regulator NarL